MKAVSLLLWLPTFFWPQILCIEINDHADGLFQLEYDDKLEEIKRREKIDIFDLNAIQDIARRAREREIEDRQ